MNEKPALHFPVFLLTHKDEMEVSALSLGKFKSGSAWLVLTISGQQHLAIFETTDAVTAFLKAEIDEKENDAAQYVTIELDREDLVEELAKMEGNIPFVAVDLASPQQKSAPLSALLAHLRRIGE